MKSFINFVLSFRFILSLLLAVPTQVFGQAALLPNGVQQFFDNNGNPLTSGTVDTYIAGTSTHKLTWKNSTETIVNTNPIVLDGGGKAIIYGSGNYRQVVKDRNGNLIWDAVTAPGGPSTDPTLIGDGNVVGTILPWAGINAPSQYAFAYGQELSRTTYAQLLGVITVTQTVTCTVGSPVLSAMSDTTQIPVGAVIENICVAPGSTVSSKTASSVTLNNNSSISTNVSTQFFLYGNGNGSTTFNLPDLRGQVIAGRNNMGGTASSRLISANYGTNPDATGASGGSQTKTLALTNLPAYTPTGTITSLFIGNAATPSGTNSAPTFAGSPATPTGTIAYASNFTPAGTNAYASNFTPAGTNTKPNVGITDPGHVHGGGDLYDANSTLGVFSIGGGTTAVTVVNNSASGTFTASNTTGITAGLDAAPVFSGTSVALPASTFTGTSAALPAATFTGISATPSGTISAPVFTGNSATPNGTVSSTFAGTPQGGSTTPLSLIQPTITLNYVIKIRPDTSISVSNVVTSIDAETGDFTCNNGISCTSNVIQLNLTPYIPSLVTKVAPNALNDYLILYDAASNATKKTSVGSVASAATAGVSSIDGATGALLLGTGLGRSGSTLLNTNPSPITNTRVGKNADFTLDVSECGDTIAMGGGGLYTATVTAATNYTTTCGVILLNEATTRAKLIAINGYSNFFLYPQQSIILYRDSGNWEIIGRSRWRPASATINFYTNFVTGTDDSDGLDITAPKKTIEACAATVSADLDFSFSPQTLAVCNMAVGITDTGGVHFSTHSLVGAQGGGAFLIQGNGGQATIATTGPVPLGFYVNSTVQLKNIIVTNSNGNCLEAAYHAYVDVLDGMRFDACTNGAQVRAIDNAIIKFSSNYSVTAGAAMHWQTQLGGKIDVGAITITATPTFNYTRFAYATQLGSITSLATFVTFAGSAGIKAQSELNSIVTQTGGCTAFPGTVAPVTSTGGQCP